MAADVSLVVDIDTDKAKRGIDTLKRGVGDLATNGVGKLNTAFQTMLGNLGAQAAAKIANIAKESVLTAFDLQKSAQLTALNLGVSRGEAETAISGIAGGGRDARVVGQIVSNLSRTGGNLGEIVKVTDAIVSMGEAMGKTTPADLFALAEAYDTVMDRFKSGLDETSSAIGTMLTKGEMQPGEIAGFAETMKGKRRTLAQVVSLVAGAADAGMAKQLKRLLVSEKGQDRAAVRRFLGSGAKGMTQEELAQRRAAMRSLSGEQVMRVIPAVTSSFGQAISKNIDATMEAFSAVEPTVGETRKERMTRGFQAAGISAEMASMLYGMLEKRETKESRGMSSAEKDASVDRKAQIRLMQKQSNGLEK